MKMIKILLSLFVLILILANSCMTMRKSDKSVIKDFMKHGTEAVIYRDTFEGKCIRYVSAKRIDKSLPTVIFVHGAPGSSSDFYKHLQDSDYQNIANLISVDRLGYGYSEYGKAEVSIEKQAKAIEQIAEHYNHNETILVGWSYGATIVGRMAVISNQYKHVIMLAPALDLEIEKHFWFGKLAKWKTTRWMSPTVFQVAEDEKLAHASELKKIENDWINITTPITYYHGNDDNLVPYENMAFLKSKISDTLLECHTIEGGSHFIPFKEYGRVKDKIISVVIDRGE